MTQAICRVHDLTMRLPSGRARAFVFGKSYDLDETLDGTPLRALLGDYVTCFDPVAPAAVPVVPASDEGETV